MSPGPNEAALACTGMTTDSARTPSRLSRWCAHDARRYFVTSVFAVVPATVVLAFLGGDDDSFLLYPMMFWSLWCVVHIAATFTVFGRRDAKTFTALITGSTRRRRSRARTLLGIDLDAVSFGAQASLLMVGLMAAVFVAPQWRSNLVIVSFAGVTVALSWALTFVSYAVEYARSDLFERGLDFPGDDQPQFSDYLYHAATVSASFATSDVDVTSTSMRKLTTSHTLIAFAYNTVILAMLITLFAVTLQ